MKTFKSNLLIISLIFISLFGIMSVSAVGNYPAVDPNMVLYFHFNNDSSVGENYGINNVTYDYSGNGNNGSNINLTNLYNQSGGYLNDGGFIFNGSNNICIKVLDANSLSFGNSSNDTAFSTSVWVYPYSFANIYTIFGKYQNPYEYYLRTETNGQVTFILRDNSAAIGVHVNSNISLNLNSWNHIITTYDGRGGSTAANGIKIYINNNDTTSGITNDVNYVSMDNTNSLFYIGIRQEPQTQPFNGTIDELIIYNKTLSSFDVWNLYYLYNGGCINVSNNLLIYGSGTLCNGSYNLYGSLNGAIQIKNNNIILDCNNSIIYGNVTSISNNFVGFYSYFYNNITLKNCFLESYKYPIKLWSSNNSKLINITTIGNGGHSNHIITSWNLSVLNSKFYNSTYGFYLENDVSTNISNSIFRNQSEYGIYTVTAGLNHYIENNTFNSGGVYFQYTNYSIVTKNLWTNEILTTNYNLQTANGYYNNYSFNNVTGFVNSLTLNPSVNFFINSERFSNIFNNSFYNTSIRDYGSTQAISIGLKSSFNNFYYNNFKLNEIAFRQTSGDGNKYYNNTINLSVTDRDGYNCAFVFESTYFNKVLLNNSEIFNNNIYNVGSCGILIRSLNNLSFHNNYIDMLPISQLGDYPVRNGGEPRCAINILEVYKTALGDSTESPTDNIINTSKYNSTNINISLNTFGDNVQCYLANQNAVNLTFTNITNYWFVSHQIPSYLVSRTDYYISNNFDNLTGKNRTESVSDLLSQGWMNPEWNYFKIHKTWRWYKNVNDTTKGNNLRLFNLSSPLISFSNGTSIFQSGTNLQYNLSLSPNNYTYILENYNCSESLQNSNGFPCGRENSPIWINYSQDGKVHIQSNSTNPITIPVYLESSGNRIFIQNGTDYTSQVMNEIVYSNCYQESTNVSNQNGNDGSCGLNYTGGYSAINFNNPQNIYDGDYGTYANWQGGTDTFYVNYSKPINSVGAFWNMTLKDGGLNPYNQYLNLSNCFNAYIDKIVLKYNQSNPSSSSYYCDNGDSNFISLGSSNGVLFYEENTNWIISTINENNLTIYPGENKVGIDCLEPFDNLVAQENMTACIGDFNITQLSIANSSIFTLNNNSNLSTDKLILYNHFNKFIKNGGILKIL